MRKFIKGYFTATHIPGSLCHLRRSHCSWRRLSLFCYLSLSCQSLQRPQLLHASVHISGLSAPFKRFLPYWCAFTGAKSAYCIFKIPFLENAVFEDENIILTEAYYIKRGKRDERKKKGEKNKGNKENDQVEFCLQVQTADLL